MTNQLVMRFVNKKKREVPEFRHRGHHPVHVKIKEGEKERLQAFEGTVIARKNYRTGRNGYGPQGQLWPGRRANFSFKRAGRRSHRRAADRSRPPREAILFSRVERKSGTP